MGRVIQYPTQFCQCCDHADAVSRKLCQQQRSGCHIDARKQLIVGGAHDASSMQAKLDMAGMDPVQRAMRGTDAAVRRATTMYAAGDEERSQHWLIVAFETDGVQHLIDKHTSLAEFLNKMTVLRITCMQTTSRTCFDTRKQPIQCSYLLTPQPPAASYFHHGAH